MHITIKNLERILKMKSLNMNSLCEKAKLQNISGFHTSSFSRAKTSKSGLSKKLVEDCEKLLNLPAGYLYRDDSTEIIPLSKPPLQLNIPKSIELTNYLINQKYGSLKEFCIAKGEDLGYMTELLHTLTRRLTPGKIIDLEEKLEVPVGTILFPDV